LPDLCSPKHTDYDPERWDEYDSPDCQLIKCLKSLKADPFCSEPDGLSEPGDCADKTSSSVSNNPTFIKNEQKKGRFNILNCVSDNCREDGVAEERMDLGNRPSYLNLTSAPEMGSAPTVVAEEADIVPIATTASPRLPEIRDVEQPIKLAKNGNYKKRMPERITELENLVFGPDSDSLREQALFFLRGEALFNEYKKLLRATEKVAKNFRGKNNPNAQLMALATAHLFDKALEKAEQGLPSFTEQELVELMAPLRKKGLSTALLRKTWNGAALAAIFDPKLIASLERLLA
jgi:hypothetical protein